MQYGTSLEYPYEQKVVPPIVQIGGPNDNTPVYARTAKGGTVVADLNYDRFVGWRGGLPGFEQLFSHENVKAMSQELTRRMTGVDPNGKRIVVTDDNITGVMSQVYTNYRPVMPDIHSKYIIESGPMNYPQDIMDRAMNIIERQVRDMILTENTNSNLSIWTTVLGDNNPHGLRSHDILKIQRKRPDPMQFHMRY